MTNQMIEYDIFSSNLLYTHSLAVLRKILIFYDIAVYQQFISQLSSEMSGLFMDDPLNGWESDDDSTVNCNNMLKVLQNKITHRPRLMSKQFNVSNNRPFTGRQVQSSVNNYCSNQNNKSTVGSKDIVRSKNKKKSQIYDKQNKNLFLLKTEEQNSSKSYILKKQTKFKGSQEPLSNLSENTISKQTQKSFRVFNMQQQSKKAKKIHRQNSAKHKYAKGEQIPLKRQSLIFNSGNSLRTKNSNNLGNIMLNFHEMQIKMRKNKPKPNNVKLQFVVNPMSFRSLKQSRSLKFSERNSSNTCLGGYTSYSRQKKQHQNEKNSRNIQKTLKNLNQSAIFCDDHLSDQFILKL